MSVRALGSVVCVFPHKAGRWVNISAQLAGSGPSHSRKKKENGLKPTRASLAYYDSYRMQSLMTDTLSDRHPRQEDAINVM